MSSGTRIRFEMVEPEMAAVLARKSGAERLQIVDRLFRSLRELIESNIRSNHPDWDTAQIRREVAGRIAGGTNSTAPVFSTRV
jgi:uncharacterized protein with von Willebrand factor type A (vWA) domain